MLRRLAAIDKRILVCLNKEDTFTTQDREKLLNQMRAQLKTVASARDFVAVRAKPSDSQHESASPHRERRSKKPSPWNPTSRRLPIACLTFSTKKGRGCCWRTCWCEHVDSSPKREIAFVPSSRKKRGSSLAAICGRPAARRAQPVSASRYRRGARHLVQDGDRHRCGVPSADGPPFGAQEMVAQAGKNLVASAGVAVATPSVASLAASALKTIPAIGTVAGGLLQGLVQALVTRWIGLVFIDYFRNEMKDPEQAIPELAKSKWSEVTRPAELARLLQEGMRAQ